MNYQKFSLIFGFFVWLLATLPFTIWGDTFFIIGNHIVLLLFFIGVMPLFFF